MKQIVRNVIGDGMLHGVYRGGKLFIPPTFTPRLLWEKLERKRNAFYTADPNKRNKYHRREKARKTIITCCKPGEPGFGVSGPQTRMRWGIDDE